jgi:hypothetical protein
MRILLGLVLGFLVLTGCSDAQPETQQDASISRTEALKTVRAAAPQLSRLDDEDMDSLAGVACDQFDRGVPVGTMTTGLAEAVPVSRFTASTVLAYAVIVTCPEHSNSIATP